MIAKIAVAAANFAIDKPYSYAITEDLQLQPGMRVMVPFGRSNRRTKGVVLSVEEGDTAGLKPVDQQLDAQPVLSAGMLRLAEFVRQRYFCTYYEAISAMLPAGLWFETKDTFSLTEDRSWIDATIRQSDAKLLLNHLSEMGGQADSDALQQVLNDTERFEKAISYLLKKKWISTHRDFKRRLSDKTEQVAILASSAEEAMEYAHTRPNSAHAQKSVLELLCSVGSASVKDICYFTGASAATVKRLAQLGYLELSAREVLRCRQIKPVRLNGPLTLNEEQTVAYEGLCAQMEAEKPGAALLYGVTGSGKTSVYIKLIQKCLDGGKQAVLLVPEIALTPQLLGLMAAYFGDQVAVLHSSLGAAERYDQWKRVRSGNAKVVIGTRSAVFAPCADLGLIILDEEQEHSYRSENTPRYAATEVALWRGSAQRALVVLGSATPSVETMFYARSGIYGFYTLLKRYNGKPLPRVEIADLRQELEQGNDSSLSYPLQDAIGETIQNGKQTVLFLNRRGNSRALVCVDCREAPECPRCTARLTYHSANERVMCHYCGYSQPVPNRCPRCSGPLKRIGTGTQKVQQELEAVFPGIGVERMDADTVSATNSHERILERFQDLKTPVLLGTQMVAKGLNLPDVTLVGVLDADLGLYSDSFRAAETTFNMLTQVVGRAGRGDSPGKAIIQTMVPEHKVLNLAAKQDYDSFYKLELEMRRVQNAPPFGDLAVITVTGADESHVMRGAVKLRDSLNLLMKTPQYAQQRCTVLGPAPCVVAKINYNFRYRLTLRCKMTKELRMLIAHLLRQFSKDKENRGICAFIDINGYDG